ncbi:MAG: hypothetical protein KDD25_09945, partial [Bdellovibrionales bacterium]|nr:hypothetical protein [Bdellovibrionales bacterium]
LGKPSSSVKRCEPQVVSDIAEIIKCLKPQNLVTHSPFDFHSTHVATVACVFLALMKLKADERPQKVFGCEVWGSLDWVPSRFRVLRPTGFDIEWEKKLIGFHRSQVTSEKDYALGALGRRLANAVFSEQKENSKSNGGIWSLDLTQAMEGGLDRYCEEVLAAFSAERMNELNNYKKDF